MFAIFITNAEKSCIESGTISTGLSAALLRYLLMTFTVCGYWRRHAVSLAVASYRCSSLHRLSLTVHGGRSELTNITNYRCRAAADELAASRYAVNRVRRGTVTEWRSDTFPSVCHGMCVSCFVSILMCQRGD